MTASDHRHPGAKKRPATPALAGGARDNLRDCREFPLIVGPPFIHATHPATSTSRRLRQSVRAGGIFDISILAQER
jgi:hypothetical protein